MNCGSAPQIFFNLISPGRTLFSHVPDDISASPGQRLKNALLFFIRVQSVQDLNIGSVHCKLQ